MPCRPEAFKAAMQCWCSGVAVVTVAHEQALHGTTVSSFSSVSLQPPLVLICLDRGGNTNALIAGAQRFAVNILAAGQEAISNRFSGDDGAVDRFEGIAYRAGSYGAPLLEGALATLECTVVQSVDGGDHTVHFGQVEGTDVSGRDPLLYFRSGYQKIVYGRRSADRADRGPADDNGK